MIPGLDGLRAIAFFLVFLDHTNYLYIGWAGVQLFFVLSGFLITDILLKLKEKFSGREYFIKFYGRRILRIFPLYYLYLLLMTCITAILLFNGYRVNYMQRFQEHLPYAVAYVYNFYIASAKFSGDSWLIGHFWSLSVEEQFYIFWPFLILLTPRKHIRKLFLTAIVLGPLVRLAITYIYKDQLLPFLSPDMPLAVYVLPFSHIDSFAMGAYISRFEIPRPKLQLAILVLLVPVLGFSTYYYSKGNFGEISALGFAYPLANAMKQVWGYSLLAYVFTVLIYTVAREKLFISILQARLLQYMGKISYGLYVYHFPVIWFMARIAGDAGVEANLLNPIIAVLSFVVTLLIASASYRYIEKPLIDLKDRFFQTSLIINETDLINADLINRVEMEETPRPTL